METWDVLTMFDNAPSGSSAWSFVVPAIIIFFIFQILVFSPQKREKEHVSFLDSLVAGDKVVTTSGIHGRVGEVFETTIQLEISEKTRITVEKSAVARRKESEKK